MVTITIKMIHHTLVNPYTERSMDVICSTKGRKIKKNKEAIWMLCD